VAAILAALPKIDLAERTALEQHAMALLLAPDRERSRWTTRETLRIIAADPYHRLREPAARTLERIARNDRHRK